MVGSPVIVAGNSIGGFISTSLAADYPQLVRGLVLLNSAGPIDKSFNAEKWAATEKSAPPRFLVNLISWGLLLYLENSIAKTLKWLYPNNPSNADEWLGDEIYRAACDPRSAEVFKAVFYLPPPRALNYLINEKYQKPTLVLQGANDPLNDSKGRAKQLEDACPNHVTVELLQASTADFHLVACQIDVCCNGILVGIIVHLRQTNVFV